MSPTIPQGRSKRIRKRILEFHGVDQGVRETALESGLFEEVMVSPIVKKSRR